ncbi:MAG: HAD family hydrolase [Candidatus Methylacidiphilales bacterium]
MKPLLLSTDFDGTLLNHDLNPAVLSPSFFEWLTYARSLRPVIWVINTGRDWPSLQLELEKRRAPVLPDWVVLIEREIHRVQSCGSLQPLIHWNRLCEESHADLFRRADAAFETTRQRLARHPELQLVVDTGSPLGLIARDNQQIDALEPDLQPLLTLFPEMHAVRNDVYIRFAHMDFHKGSCLGTVLAEEGLSAAECFAAGDNLNDLAMLDRRYAHYITCPSNSLPEVKKHVQLQGGWVDPSPADEGIVNALCYFFPELSPSSRTGRVSSSG